MLITCLRAGVGCVMADKSCANGGSVLSSHPLGGSWVLAPVSAWGARWAHTAPSSRAFGLFRMCYITAGRWDPPTQKRTKVT